MGHGEDWDEMSRTNPKFATDVAVELRQAHSKRAPTSSAVVSKDVSYLQIRQYQHPFRLAEFDKYPVENLEDYIKRRAAQREEERALIPHVDGLSKQDGTAKDSGNSSKDHRRGSSSKKGKNKKKKPQRKLIEEGSNALED